MEVGDLTFIGEGCRGPLRCDRVIFPREMISQDMDPVGGNKPVEVPDSEDSFTMVAFFGQQRSEPLVGDLISSPESSVGLGRMRGTPLLSGTCADLEEMGPV